MEPLSFLRFIWPSARPVRFCITRQAIDNDGKEEWRNRWCDGIDQAVAQVQQLAGQGFDVFHCMAAFLPGSTERKDKNVIATRAIYLDLDIARPGSQKPNTYADRTEAANALAAFVRSTGIPTPNLVVSSGWGMHVYWVLDEDLTLLRWRPLAVGLRNAALAHGMRFDQQVTVTLSRVLRTPGTWNYKNKSDPKLAQVLYCSGKHLPVAAFAPLVQLAQSNVGLATGTLVQSVPTKGTYSDLSANMDKLRGPSSMANVVRKCPVMQQMLLSGGAIGGYPLWRDMMSIAAFTDDGHLFVDPMSYKHHTYSRSELERQWQYAIDKKARGDLGPGRCATIAGEGGQAQICQTCPHNGVLTSPIQLSYGVAQPAAPAASAVQLATPPSPQTEGPALQDPQPPYGFQVLPQGGYGAFVEDKETGLKQLVPVLAGRVSRVERRHEEIKGAGARPGSEPVILVVQYHPGNGPGRSIRVPIGALNLKNDAILGGLGFIVTPGRHREALQMFRSWSDQLARVAQGQFEARHYGWADYGDKKGFVVGDRVHWDNGTTDRLMLPPTTAPLYTPQGSFEAWRVAAQAHHDAFSQPLRAILAGAFAAPLVNLSGRSGGRLLSIVGTDTGVGKTTAMDLGQSVWGDAIGTLRMNATANAVPEFVSQLKSLPVFWDETRGIESEQYMNLMFSIVEGRGRMRLNSQVELREAAHWNNMVITASNFSTRDRAALTETVPGEGPQKARIFECIVPPSRDMRVIDNLHLMGQQARNNRGHAGDAYARFVVANWRSISAKIAELETALAGALNAPTSSRFHISTMALLLTGAWLATRIGILAFDVVSLRDYLVGQYRIMTAEPIQIVTPQEAKDITAVRIMEEFLSSHQAATLATHTTTQLVGKGRPSATMVKEPTLRNGDATQIHIVLNQGVMLIDARAMWQWLVKTGRVKQTVKDLFREVFGAAEAQHTLGAGTPFSRLRIWCLVVPLVHAELAQLANNYGSRIPGFALPEGTSPAAVAPTGQSPYLMH